MDARTCRQDLDPRELAQLQEVGGVQHTLTGGDPHPSLEHKVRGRRGLPHGGLGIRKLGTQR